MVGGRGLMVVGRVDRGRVLWKLGVAWGQVGVA